MEESAQAKEEAKIREKLSLISPEEIDIINDIRGLDFGRITVFIQNGVIVSKEITKVVKNHKNHNNNNNGKQNSQLQDYKNQNNQNNKLVQNPNG